MNIFYLHKDPIKNAEYHCDKHIVKMATEYCQLLSTAHRILDGKMYLGKTKNNRNIKRWRLPDEREDILMKASHVNHPSNIWVRESRENYMEMYFIYMATLGEYTYRYGKIHGSSKASMILQRPPKNIISNKNTEMVQAMPDYCKINNDPISAYRNYYIKEKKNFVTWKNRPVPEWYPLDNQLIRR